MPCFQPFSDIGTSRVPAPCYSTLKKPANNEETAGKDYSASASSLG